MSDESGKGLTREQWGSRLGFILAAAGSAIGLGNVWRFPYLVGENGGAVFVLVYLFITVLIGLPVMLAEFAIGRAAQRSPVAAFRALNVSPFWGAIGWLGTLAGGFFVLSYYNVIGGWTIRYMLESLGGLMETAATGQSKEFFGHFIGQRQQVLMFQIVFSGATMLFVLSGIGKGIERACKVMMPALFLILVVLIIRSLTLPGAEAGIEFYLKPDLSKLTRSTFLSALGQSFFSLSLGLGIMLTYGSYLGREERIPSATVWTASLDTLIALLSGFAIFPAMFAMGFEPGQGVGLTFITLPAVFAKMPAGQYFSFLFFLFLFFAAVTSSMSLMEVATTFAIEKFNLKRVNAVCLMGIIIFLLGGYSAISLAGDPKVAGMDFLDALDYLCNNVMLPVGSFLVCVFVGWFWLDPALKELTNNGKLETRWWLHVWVLCVRVLAPIAILFIFLNGTGLLETLDTWLRQ
ncbi:MAG: sodium-dependent transporter [Synergistaceae bacterium]|nr:sodium-dependent transporter [Synergistaceae bacterium]